MQIGIDLGGTKIEVVALDRAGAELVRQRTPTPVGDYFATVGVGIPGTISPATGIVKNANSTWLNGRPLDRDLEVVLHRPVRMANDANCFTLSEVADGVARGSALAFGVILGTGVGGGVVIDGRPHAGSNRIAGEWGHNPLPGEPGQAKPRCWCGRCGCIETYLSGPGLARDHLETSGRALTPEEIVAAAPKDAAAAASLGRYEERLARAMATVINLLDPDVIVLGGGLSNLGHLYEAVPRLWERWIFSDEVNTRLVAPLHGDSSGVRGAARLWPAEHEA